jgi:cysteine synthase
MVQVKRCSKIYNILKSGYETLVEDIGTRLVKLHKLSFLLNRSIYVKMESLNPSGTGKDPSCPQHVERCRIQRFTTNPHTIY